VSRYTPKNRSELRQLAMDIVNGHVFTSRHIRESRQDMMGMVFMPVLFMTPEQQKEWEEAEITLIYEYLSKAGQRSINGYPIFMSCNSLDKTDDAKVWELVREAEIKAKEFLDPPKRSKCESVDPNQTVLFEDQEAGKGKE